MFKTKQESIKAISKNIREASRWIKSAGRDLKRGRRQSTQLAFMEAIKEKLLNNDTPYGHYAYMSGQ